MSAKKRKATAEKGSTKKKKASAEKGKEHKPEEEADFCARNLLAKNPNISKETAESICLAMNNILTAQKRDHIPKIFEENLDIWFKNFTVTEEIFKTIKSKDLCFLHSVRYDFESEKFTIATHIGKNAKGKVDLNFQKYYNDQIKGCQSNLMALPLDYIRLAGSYSSSSHATMIIIELGSIQQNGKQLVEVEHFDSSNINKEQIKKPIEDLIKSLFGEDSYVFRFHHQDEVCNSKIQGKVLQEKNKYSGSCSQFALWYAFKRLLEPHKKRDQVVREMYELFNGKKDPDEVMIGLIHTFQSLLRFDTTWDDKFYELSVNGRDIVNDRLAAEIKKKYLEAEIKKFKEARDICRQKCLENNDKTRQHLLDLKTDEEFEKFCLEDRQQPEEVKNACNHAKTLREKIQGRLNKIGRTNLDYYKIMSDFNELIDRKQSAPFGNFGIFNYYAPVTIKGGFARRKNKRRVSKTRRKK